MIATRAQSLPNIKMGKYDLQDWLIIANQNFRPADLKVTAYLHPVGEYVKILLFELITKSGSK